MKKCILLLLPALLILVLIAGCEQQLGKKETVLPAKKEVSIAKEAPMAAPRVTPKPTIVKEVVAGELLVADFDSGDKPNNIGGNFGAWDKDPADFSQGCAESFDSVNRRGTKGFGMKIDYDVDSQNPAYNGFWMFLQGLDASKYNNLSLWVKGDLKEGYTTVFKVELKNAQKQVGRYYITNVTDQWQEIIIPLNEFKGINDFSNFTEFVIVFEDRIASNKDGAIYIDDLKFTK